MDNLVALKSANGEKMFCWNSLSLFSNTLIPALYVIIGPFSSLLLFQTNVVFKICSCAGLCTTLQHFIFSNSCHFFTESLKLSFSVVSLQCLLRCLFVIISSLFECSNCELGRWFFKICAYLWVVSSCPTGLQAFHHLHLNVKWHPQMFQGNRDLLLSHRIRQCRFYVGVKRSQRACSRRSYIWTFPIRTEVIIWFQTSIGKYSVCIALAKGNSVSSIDTCLVVKMSLESWINILYIPSPESKGYPGIGRSSNLSVLFVACLCVYATQPEIHIFEGFGAFPIILLEGFSCQGREWQVCCAAKLLATINCTKNAWSCQLY